MKKIIKILLIITTILNTFSFNILLANANTTTYTATVTDPEGINVRSESNTNGKILGVLSYKSKINLNNNTKYTGNGCNGWYQINYNNKTGYICSELVSVTSSTTTVNNTNYYTTSSWNARVNENYINVRSSANGSVIESIYLGTDLTILEKTSNKNNCSKGWYKVNYYNNKTGYVCGNMVDEYNEVTKTNTNYYETLKSLGFPESYWPMLTYLHEKHPTWTFKVIKTNKNFNDAVSGEQGKNYIQSTYDTYRTSSRVAENPNWYVATNGVIAFYLDPRNYLNEKNIFVFENLAYDKETQTSETVKAIFKDTYLATDEYVGYFMEAANTYNISPIHLATRVKQEGATNETYDAISGNSNLTYDGKSLKGFYNYYNIGAYQDSKTSSSVARGLAVAAGYIDSYSGIPWTSRKQAIIYGAKFIADSYINKGQNTLYFQKFNTSSESKYSAYTHQYMTNITAPASESLSTYNSYNNLNLLDTAYTFTIPVYENMPKEFTALPTIGNSNTNIKEIKINNKLITGFDKDVVTYDYYVPKTTEKINISATPETNLTTITGTGEIAIKNDITTITLTTKSEVGSTKAYTINIIRANEETEIKPEEIINTIDVKFSNNFLTGIAINTNVTAITNEINQLAPSAKVEVINKDGKIKNDNLATGDKIKITSFNETKEYTISIKGDPSGDGKITILDLLKVQKAILGKETLLNEYKDAADINYDGKTTILDLLKVQKAILGKESFK